jgi:N-glycosylase/DNA lyase
LRGEALNLQRRDAARVDFGRFTPVVFTLVYYAVSPLYGARTHLGIHAAATMNRALADAKFEIGWDADPWSLALWTARDSVVPVLAVAALLVVVDRGARRELVPSFVADPIRRWTRVGRRRDETRRRRR